MANFFRDNEDIKFLFEHYDLARIAALMEEDFRFAEQFDYAPRDAGEAIENYRNVLNMLGELSGEYIAPRAEDVDRIGSRLNDDGTVSYAPGIVEDLQMLAKADVMGFTLPHRFGGLNFPNLIYTMATEIVSRADASLMNIFGLQGIAETINAYASEEIKSKYLPQFAAGKVTGAMALTEPEAGSDLQSVRLRATQVDDGKWVLNGVKRFITNGCGEVLLVLARSEPEISDGRGLSLFLTERSDKVRVRRIEDKLGIHGSPTCELQFNDAPALLIGERQRGLITYVMSLMNGARVGIAAQSLGIGEAAFRVARSFANKRVQFGQAIEQFPAVREMLIDMRVDLEAARTLTYETSYAVDIEYGLLRKIEFGRVRQDEDLKQIKQDQRAYKRLAAMLTPMAKYYASEMCVRVANEAVCVLGGSGYMRDYPVERLLRDARITTIYEGTTQLQIVAAVRGVCSGTAEKFLARYEQMPVRPDLQDVAEKLREGRKWLAEAVPFVKSHGTTEYMDLYGRKIVDLAIWLIVGQLFLRQAHVNEHKVPVLRRWVSVGHPKARMLAELINSGDRSVMADYEQIVGPPPVEE